MDRPRIEWKVDDIAVVREHYDQAGKHYRVLGPAVFKGQWWVPIDDPDEEDPSYYKEVALFKATFSRGE